MWQFSKERPTPARLTLLLVLLLRLDPTGSVEFFTGMGQYFTGCVPAQLCIRTAEDLGIIQVWLMQEVLRIVGKHHFSRVFPSTGSNCPPRSQRGNASFLAECLPRVILVYVRPLKTWGRAISLLETEFPRHSLTTVSCLGALLAAKSWLISTSRQSSLQMAS